VRRAITPLHARVCCTNRDSWSRYPVDDGEPYYGYIGSSEHRAVCRAVYMAQAKTRCKHLGWRCRRGFAPSHGVDCLWRATIPIIQLSSGDLPAIIFVVDTNRRHRPFIDRQSPFPVAFFMLLFSWQFPHFNSLSYVVRSSYAQAGYRMLSVLSPSHNSMVALRHAILLIPICSVLFPLSGLTTWMFALTSLVPNAICTRAAWRFWKAGGEKEARLVFQHSLWYLPVILALMMVHKQGMDWAKWFGIEEDEGRVS
jgi:hypothetical protein